jgi:hypothetical protein
MLHNSFFIVTPGIALPFMNDPIILRGVDRALITRVNPNTPTQTHLFFVRVVAFVNEIEAKSDDIVIPNDVLEQEIAEYAGVRSAVGEITTTCVIISVGYFVFQTVTPGVISITGPVAELRAHSLAIAQFPLGQGLGGMYYGVFSTNLEPWKLVATGVVLAMLASVVTTFAGVIADPLQVMTGTHRRRLCRLLDHLDIASDRKGNIAREHITARLADLTDIALNIWRTLRG